MYEKYVEYPAFVLDNRDFVFALLTDLFQIQEWRGGRLPSEKSSVFGICQGAAREGPARETPFREDCQADGGVF